MVDEDDVVRREWLSLNSLIDPMAAAVIAADDPWAAYEAACAYGSILDDPEMPHGGGLYCAWAELTDVYETGKTDIAVAHDLLRRSAEEWLARPAEPSGEWLEAWIDRTREAVATRFHADGDFWNPPAE